MNILPEIITSLALLLQSLEDPFLFMALVTALALGIGIYKRGYAVAFFATIALTFSTTHIIKSIFKVARPDDALVVAQGYRFPSMHTAIGAAILTSIAWYICMHTPSKTLRILILALLGASTLFIGWTRIFLGVHEIIDVTVGIAIGTSISLCVHGAMHFFKLDQ